MIDDDRVEHATEAGAPEFAAVDEPAVMFYAEPPAKFCVRVTNGELFGEMSIGDQMRLVRRVLRIDRKCDVARPVAGFVRPLPLDATGTRDIRTPYSGA